ncbi:MAG: hypothetical protein EB127_10740, partial [Alphaproteobacteria bacterium]|nr:hypothetical protein [Alphaproteobacteria bacterium]
MRFGNQIINFKARSKSEFESHLKPYPAVKSLPDWFKKSSPYITNDLAFPNDGKSHVRARNVNHNFKKCTPLLDGMSMGYIIPLWADVEIVSNNEEVNIFWKTRSDVFQLHGESTKEITQPYGYSSQVFKYLNCWIPQTPPGYSCLIISPFGHNDLTIKAIPAVVDTDKST